MKKKLFSLILTIALVFTMMPTSVFAIQSSVSRTAQVFKVSTAKELETVLNKGIDADIEITADFNIDRTFYVSAPTTIRTTSKHTLTRAKTFTGDVFVIGEDNKGRESTLSDKKAELTLGDPNSKREDLLVIDGNKDEVYKGLKVSGTVLFLCYAATVNVYPNVTVQNCKKQTNLKTTSENYAVSYPMRIGGSMAIVCSGSLNIFGGNFKDNTVNDEVENESAENPNYRLCTQGGVIYNFGNVKIYGGTFSDNHGARGGVLYNYKKFKIYGGIFENNTASKYAGVAYLPDSQYSNIIMGGNQDAAAKVSGGKCDITFKGNTAVSTGGVFHGQTKSGIVIYEDANALFEGNHTVRFNGGAIATSGALTIKGGATFKNNDSNSKGGALFISKSKLEFQTRKANISNAVFVGNVAARGGAVGVTAKTVELPEGGIAAFKGCTFEGNKAIEKTAYGKEVPDTAINGGAFYVSRKSTLTVDDCDFNSNVSTLKEGGAVYITAQSKVAIKNSRFDGNITEDYLEGCGGAVAVHGSKLTIDGATFKNNHSARHGSSLYCSYKNLTENESVHSRVIVKNSTFDNNVSGYHGGGIYVTSKDCNNPDNNRTNLYVNNCTFKDNQAENNGGGIYFTKSIGYLKDNTFTGNHVNARVSDSGKRYGGAAIYSSASKVNINGAEITGNTSDFNGGAIEAHTGSEIVTNKVVANNNQSLNHGGAVYVNRTTWTDYDGKYTENKSGTYGGGLAIFTDAKAKLFNTISNNNTATLKGGGIYFFGGSNSYLENVTVNGNKTESYDTDETYGGGGIYITGTRTMEDGTRSTVGSHLEMNGGTISNNQGANKGGAIAAFSSGEFVLNKLKILENTSAYRGGVIYSSGSDFDAFDCDFEKNSSVDYGGAIAIPSNPVNAGFYNCKFTKNKIDTVGMKGGAIWLYSRPTEEKDAKTIIHSCEFTDNEATVGGAICAQNASKLEAYNNKASKVAGMRGEFLYVSSADGPTEATVNGLAVNGYGVADTINCVYSPIFRVNPDSIVGSAGNQIITIQPEWTITKESIPEAKKYEPSCATSTYVEPSEPSIDDIVVDEDADQEYVIAENSSVDNAIFKLAEGKPLNSKISDRYDKFPVAKNKTNFQSRGVTTFNNVNGKTVTCESFVLQPGDRTNNTIYPVGLMIYQAMDYKRAHPTEKVKIDLSTFRLSEETAININRKSKYFGYMRNLIGKNFDKNGFVRISYLLVQAAKMGINVNVIGQIEGMPLDDMDPGFEAFFNNHLSDDCDSKYVKTENKTVADYLDFNLCQWTSYNNLPAADMMHTKICAVSKYRDMNGKDHANAIWLGSANIDGILPSGLSGRNRIQTAIVVSDHEALYRTSVNYLKLVSEYCEQEDIKDFRELVCGMNEKQIKLLQAGQSVPKDQQIVYLGGKNDKVFELYFTPMGGDVGTWDENNNPFCKYVKKMRHSDDYITFIWNNPKYVKSSYQLARTLESMVNQSFTTNKNKNNRVFIQAKQIKETGVHAFDGTPMENLKLGKEIGYVSINEGLFSAVHSKDMQLSYSNNGKRQYVSILNSLNFHQGASFYQSNHILVVKEASGSKNSVFYNIAKYTTSGIVKNDISKASVSISKKTYTYDGKSKKPSVKVSMTPVDYVVKYDKNCKSVGKHTVTIAAKGVGINSKKLTYTINPRGTFVKTLRGQKKSVKLKWQVQNKKMANSRITGYVIQCSTSRTFKNITKTIALKSYKTNSCTIGKLKAKKIYYFRIKTYKTVGGVKYYSAWSQKHSVRTK